MTLPRGVGGSASARGCCPGNARCPLPCALCPFIYVGHAALTEGCLLPALRLSCDNRARRAPLGSLLGSSSSSSSRAAPAPLLHCSATSGSPGVKHYAIYCMKLPLECPTQVCVRVRKRVCVRLCLLCLLYLSLSLSRVCQLEPCVL